jgi:hypothetical protein
LLWLKRLFFNSLKLCDPGRSWADIPTSDGVEVLWLKYLRSFEKSLGFGANPKGHGLFCGCGGLSSSRQNRAVWSQQVHACDRMLSTITD